MRIQVHKTTGSGCLENVLISMTSKENSKYVNFIWRGDGPPVLLIHGMAASLYDWEKLIPALAISGYRAYALDLLGHGESVKPEDVGQYRIEALFAYLKEWIDKLDLETPPVLVGHSLGGYLSLVYAQSHPDKVRGLVLIDPLYSDSQLSPFMRLIRRRPALGVKAWRAIPDWVIHTVMGWEPATAFHFTPESRQQIVDDYKRAAPQILYITQFIPDLTPILPDINTPALILWGEKDLTLKPASFPRLAEALPNATSQSIQGCGHQPHIGKPEKVNQLVISFINRQAVDSHPASR
jgi:pimeloyl-ACP methyl ester carboxylesterase